MSDRICRAYWLGNMEYNRAWRLQRRIAAERLEGRRPDTFLIAEHPPVYTFGLRSADTDFLLAPSYLRLLGAPVYQVDRGGGVTFHGPGQLVGYPIVDLREWDKDLHGYVRALEELLIRVLSEYGIASARVGGLTGVWVGNDKIAAIGAKVSRWVTTHGFALNVNVNLEWFGHIIACGIQDRGVTSMERLLGREVRLEDVMARLIDHFGRVFGRQVTLGQACELGTMTEGASHIDATIAVSQ